MDLTGKKLLLEMDSLSAPGHDRGLGRYTKALRQAYGMLGIAVTDVSGSRALDIRPGGPGLRGVPLHVTAPHHLPVVKRRPWICSIQDTIPLDLTDYSRLGLKSKLEFANARRADIVIANSQHTAERVAVCLRRPVATIPIVPLPLSSDFLDVEAKRLDDRGHYVAALIDLRTFDPRKRIRWLAPIAAELADRGLELVVAGRGLERVSEVLPGVRVQAVPTDAELIKFLGSAKAFVYMSAYEGQGLPPLEAMALGTPVVAYANTSITEMIGRGGMLLDDPVPWEQQRLDAELPRGEARAFAEAVLTVCHPERWSTASHSARSRAQDFSSEAFAHRLGDAVESAIT